MKKYNISFTLFGDSCQSIFDYEAKNTNDINSDFFYKKMCNYYKRICCEFCTN